MKKVFVFALTLLLGGCAGQSSRIPSCGVGGFYDGYGNHVGSRRWADMNFVNTFNSTPRVHVIPAALNERGLPPGVEYADYLASQSRRIEAPGLRQMKDPSGNSFWQTKMKGCDIDFDIVIPYRTETYSAARADVYVFFVFHDIDYVGDEQFITVPLSAVNKDGFWDIYPRGYSY